jgi:hypothetical protein
MASTPTPPSNDPSLPSYQCPDYDRLLGVWQFISDMYKGRRAWVDPILGSYTDRAKIYLPPGQNEPVDPVGLNGASPYKSRLLRSPFERLAATVIDSWASAFNSFTFGESAPDMISEARNVDLNGSTWQQFRSRLNLLAMQYRYCLVLVDKQESNQARNRKEELDNPRQAFCSIYKPTQLINWRLEVINGSQQFTQATLVEEHIKEANGYGDEKETLYRVLTPGHWKLIRLRKPEHADKWIQEVVSEGDFIARSGAQFGHIPLSIYSHSPEWLATPLFLGCCDRNLLHYQQESNRLELIHKCCMPVPVLSLGQNSTAYDEHGNLSIGPNDFLDVGTDGSFRWESPNPGPLEHLLVNCQDIRKQILEESFRAVLEGNAERTATEIRFLTGGLISRTKKMGQTLDASFSQVLHDWGLFEGVDASMMIKTDVNLNALLFTVEDLVAVHNGNLLSQKTAIKQIASLGLSDNPEEELKLLNEEIEKTTQARPDPAVENLYQN